MKKAVYWILIGMVFSAPAVWAMGKKPVSGVQAELKRYACPMQCVIAEKPGKCPKCGMEMWELSAS